jgi:glycerophosphoryl diester phosphodiesterase
MVHPALARDSARVFAHRGGAALRPENTLAAFEHARALGVHGIELDVRLARDGEPVVIHDATLDRTTDASGPVAARTSDELARVDAGARFGGADGFPFRGRGVGVPRLADVLAHHPHTPLIVELKDDRIELAVSALRAVREADAEGRVVLGSFHHRVLRAVRAEAPGLPTGASRLEVRVALYRSWVGWPLGRPAYRAFQVPEQSGLTRVISPRFVRAAHASGAAVQVWTVNHEDDMRRLLAWGVDGLITDRPDLAGAIVGVTTA